RTAWTELQEREETEAQQVSDWQAVYESLYSETSGVTDAQFNIVGWQSSYTGLPIPAEEMQEWVDNTVSRVLALSAKRVVEIGCGTGLILFRVAPHCIEYTGTDFSAEAIQYVGKVLADWGASAPRVNLQQRSAEEFADFGADVPDTVILNSVVQYFPSLD